MKKIITIIVALALIGAGVYFWTRNGDDTAAAEPRATTATAARSPMRLSVECTGVVVSNLDVEIKCQASGAVIAVPFDISDPVNEGDLLVELDPQDEERNVRKSQTDLLSARARLNQASDTLRTAEQDIIVSARRLQANLESAIAQRDDSRAKADRMEQLLKSNRVSAEENETAQTAATLDALKVENARIELEQLAVDRASLAIKREDVRRAEADVENSRISLEIAQKRLKDTRVFAPISGIVADRQVQIGQIISSAISNVGGGSTLMVLSDLSRVFILASVDESDIGQIREGQPVEITVDAYPDDKFSGNVDRIATKGVNVSNVVTFEVKIEVLGEGKIKLKPEMTANVDILVAEDNNALVVPSEAVQRKGGQRYVLLPGAVGAEPVSQPVETGIDDGVQIQILSGIEEGTVVVLPSGSAVGQWSRDGQNQTRTPAMIPGVRPGAGRR